MRRGGSSWWRQWKSLAWCSLCLMSLLLLLLRDSLPVDFPYDLSGRRSRKCPPSIENDFCISWRPLTVTHGVCGCPRKIYVLHNECTDVILNSASAYMLHTQEIYGNSTCSSTSTLRGPRQHVLVYSLPSLTEEAGQLVNITMAEVKEVYKGWIVRVYVKRSGFTPPTIMCSLICTYDNLDICDVTDVPEPISNTKDRDDPGWHWAVLGDPLVEAWETRNIKSSLLPRDKHAVTQFINSDQCWHLMRDHKSQTGELGSGNVGGKLSYGREELLSLRHTLFHHLLMEHLPKNLLEEELLSTMGSDIMYHDSISCWANYGSIPFPSEREPGTWVGMHRKIRYHNLKANNATFTISSKLPSLTALHTRPNLAATRSRVPGNIITRATKSKMTVPLSAKEINTKYNIDACPIKCRPYKHRDWIYC